MRGLRADKIQAEEEQVKDPLRGDDRRPLEQRRLCHLDKGHQVHSLILRLVHEGANPAPVILHATKGLEMVERRANHAGDSGNGLKHHSTMAVTLGEKRVGEPAQGLGNTECNAVGKVARLMMDGKVRQECSHNILHDYSSIVESR